MLAIDGKGSVQEIDHTPSDVETQADTSVATVLCGVSLLKGFKDRLDLIR